jgi:hypothetical protein
MPDMMMTSFPPLQPAWGRYQSSGQPSMPVQITQIEVSGWAWTPQGYVPIHRARLDPARTRLESQCSCPIHWSL